MQLSVNKINFEHMCLAEVIIIISTLIYKYTYSSRVVAEFTEPIFPVILCRVIGSQESSVWIRSGAHLP